MNLRWLVPAVLLAWVGLTLVVGAAPGLRRPRLSRRVVPPPRDGRVRAGTWWSASFDVIAPVAVDLGNRVGTLLGVHDELALRLERAGVGGGPTAFRLHQMARAAVALLIAAAGVSVAPVPAVAVPLILGGAPVLTFLVIEQSSISASTAWQHRLTQELPTVTEQLGMLLSSGYSLGGAIARLARRGNGICSEGFTRVTTRVRQGLGVVDALREWASVAQVPALDRLVTSLELHHHASDLGELISAEARSTRREVQRELEELIERRQQTVWVPVTVATLLPGVMFMAVPFVDAMGQLTG